MREVANPPASPPALQSIDLRLWAGVLLAPFAGGANTLVGYMVSNYDCNVHNRSLVLLVNAAAFLLCALAFFLSFSARRFLRSRRQADDLTTGATIAEIPWQSREFMAYLGYGLSAGFALFIFAGTLSSLFLGPCDL
jgi:hypothetical protein